jgi:hypothetical protein
MNKYLPLVDVNTKNVYKWTLQKDDGSETVKILPKALWKPLNNWSEADLEALFREPTVAEVSLVESAVLQEDPEVSVYKEKTAKPKYSLKLPF